MSYPPPPPSYGPPPSQPRRRAPLMAAVATAVVVALVALGVRLAVRDDGPPASAPATLSTVAVDSSVAPCDEQPADPETGPATGDASLGDPYLCWAGGAGYDALSYDVRVSVEPDTAQITGHAEVVVRITDDVDAVHLDLGLGLEASEVTVDGAPVKFAREGLDLAVPTDAAVDDEVTVGVDYSGVPEMESDMGEAVLRQGSEILLADEPAGSVTWMPLSSHPSDPAAFRVEVSVPRDVEAISVGRLLSNGPDPDAPERDLWVWAPDELVVNYTIMLAVGQYELDGPRDVTVGGKTVQYLSAAPAGADAAATLEWLSLSVEAAEALTELAGPYPLTSIGGVVPPMATNWGALETHGRPVYDPRYQRDDIMTHELSHFWFGNTVTLARWDDIVINEGLATYSEYAADFTGRNLTPDEFLESAYDSRHIDWGQAISDPGPGLDTFSTKVYEGGGAALQALRNRMGDEAFLAFIRAWADQQGPHSLEEFRTMAQEYSPTDVSGLLAAWFDGTQRPARTAQNGLGG